MLPQESQSAEPVTLPHVVVGQVLIGGWRASGEEAEEGSEAGSEEGGGEEGATEGDQQEEGEAASPMMQGIVACPFYLQHLREQRQGRRIPAGTPNADADDAPPAGASSLGVGDSLLLFLHEAHHSPSPPFETLRVHPIKNAPGWRARLVRLPFARNWNGELFEEQRAAAENQQYRVI